MSAQVIRGGHASQLVETDFLEACPQVHLHFLTEAAEYKELGYGRVEVCCHGCGEALLIYYVDGEDSRLLGIRDEFTQKHKGCKNHQFERWCPDYRSSSQVVDLRPQGRWKNQRRVTPRVLQTAANIRHKVVTKETTIAVDPTVVD